MTMRKGSDHFKIICLLMLIFGFGCMKNIPYEQDQVNAFFKRKENVQLSFTTNKGKQVAFYIPPLTNKKEAPKKLAILYPGIQSVALEWLPFIRLEDDNETGYLLIEYPGRGYSEGLMNPKKVYKNTEGDLVALAKYFEMKELEAELSLLGHSFGTGAALQFATRSRVSRIVLTAPFNSMRKALAQRSFILSLTSAKLMTFI